MPSLLLTVLFASPGQCNAPVPVKTSAITSHYGYRKIPGRQRQFHYGLDIGAKRGTPVRAITAGNVTYTGGHHNVVIIWNRSTRYSVHITYAHLDKVLVSNRDKVKAGDVIGTVGNSGSGKGNLWHFTPHLHLTATVKNPQTGNIEKQDPMKVLGLCKYRSVANRQNIAYRY